MKKAKIAFPRADVRIVRQWKMFTLDGQPVFTYGHSGYSLDATRAVPGLPSRSQATCYDFDGLKNRAHRIDKATEKLGVRVEWRDAGTTEMMFL